MGKSSLAKDRWVVQPEMLENFLTKYMSLYVCAVFAKKIPSSFARK